MKIFQVISVMDQSESSVNCKQLATNGLRLHTRAHTIKPTVMALDITARDNRSPPLELYVVAVGLLMLMILSIT